MSRFLTMFGIALRSNSIVIQPCWHQHTSNAQQVAAAQNRWSSKRLLHKPWRSCCNGFANVILHANRRALWFRAAILVFADVSRRAAGTDSSGASQAQPIKRHTSVCREPSSEDFGAWSGEEFLQVAESNETEVRSYLRPFCI